MLSTLRRPGQLFCALTVLLAVLLGSVPHASAASDPGWELVPGWIILDGTVTGPGLTQPRHLNSSQAAAFIQAWYGATIFGTLKAAPRPTNVDVYKVTVRDTIRGRPQHFIAYYATKGPEVLVGMPPQTIGGGAFVPKEKWFIAPARTKAAFEGRLAPIVTHSPTTTTAPKQTAAAPSRSSSSSWWPVAGATLAGGVVVAGVVAFSRRRRPAKI
jgi:hypothetical protein